SARQGNGADAARYPGGRAGVDRGSTVRTRTMTGHPTTLGSALGEAAHRRGEAPFILHGDTVTSYRELEDASRRVAAGLMRLGLEPGDRIGLLALNRIEWLILFFAAVRVGVAVVAMSPRYRESELGYMVRDSEVKAVASITEHEGHDFAAMFARLAPELPSLRHLILFPAATDAALPAGTPALPRVLYTTLLEADGDATEVERAAVRVT